MSALNFHRVGKRFGPVEVIRDFSLQIGSGEFAVFVGPSGCGKSTLLRMVAGLESLSGGEILLSGRRIDTLAPGDRGVAMVFQHYALYPHMTVRQNMAFGLRNVGVPGPVIAQKIATAAEMLEIGPLLDRKPAQLSGGQRQRVAIGRAIVKQPNVFLFDEPLSNLDAALRGRTRIELARLHQRVRATMVFVTHDQVEAMTMASRIVVMNRGRVEQVGAPMDVYERPETRFVAGFIGTPAMNFLNVASVSEDGGMARLVLKGGMEVATEIPIGALRTQAGLTLGIRAENVLAGAGVPARVDVIERLGDRTLVYALLGNGETIVFAEPGAAPVRVGDTVDLSFQESAIHLFGPDGMAIRAG